MTDVRINRRMNLVIPVDTDTGRVFVHSVPIARDVFEMFYDVLGITFRRLMEGGGIIAGPSMAFLELRATSKRLKIWDGDGGVEKGLVGEIMRLTNVMCTAAAGGWDMIPLEMFGKRAAIDEDASAEILGQLIFFTCVSTIAPKGDRAMLMDSINSIWGSALSALDASAYRNSLPISTPEAPAVTPSTTAVPS